MGRLVQSSTLAFCCRAPAGGAVEHETACLAAAGRGPVAVTWCAPLERLASLAACVLGGGGSLLLALEVPPTACQSRPMLRRLLAEAHDVVPDLDVAVVRGPMPHDCRKVLAESGIGVVLRDTLDDETRGARRPAPRGWPCRNVLWGLWEIAMTTTAPPGMLRAILPWRGVDGLQPGGLAVVDVSGQAATSTTIGGRLDRWHAWARRRAGAVRFSTVSALPELIANGSRQAAVRSVLRAA